MGTLKSNALVSLDQAREYLQLPLNDTGDDAAEDATIRDIINAVSEHIENWCGRTFVKSGAITEVRNGNGSTRMLLRNGPPAAITSIKYWDGTAWTAIASTITYTTGVADGNAKSLMLYFTDGTKFTEGLRWQIIYTSAYSSIANLPDDLQSAALAMVGREFKRRQDRLHGVTQRQLGDETISYSFDMPKDVRAILENYVLDVI